MTMLQQFKVGDQVVVNERNATFRGKKGVVKYASGPQYWVKFADGQLSPALDVWMLVPAK